jgi:hypothetical protein
MGVVPSSRVAVTVTTLPTLYTVWAFPPPVPPLRSRGCGVLGADVSCSWRALLARRSIAAGLATATKQHASQRLINWSDEMHCEIKWLRLCRSGARCHPPTHPTAAQVQWKTKLRPRRRLDMSRGIVIIVTRAMRVKFHSHRVKFHSHRTKRRYCMYLQTAKQELLLQATDEAEIGLATLRVRSQGCRDHNSPAVLRLDLLVSIQIREMYICMR